jgi:outer membrane protein assembly factor BamB
MCAMTRRIIVLLVLLSSAALLAQRPSGDWTQWRGPNRDGTAPAFTPPKAWPDMLTRRWKIEVGLGYSTPLIVGDRLFTFTRQGDDEVVMALDAASGKQIWATKYPAPYSPVKAAMAHGTGPKGTPVFADGKLFTFGISGILTAFDAATGKQLWQKPAPEVGPTFTTSQSPIVDRNMLIVHLGGNNKGALTAFDPNTGTPRWQWDGDGPAYGSPVVADIAGTRQIVTFTYQNLVGVAVDTGELLWKRPFRSASEVNSVTPIVIGDTVVVSGGGNGVAAVRIAKTGNQWSFSDAWTMTDAEFRFSNLVLAGDALFGLGHQGSGTYVIIDAKTGKLVWKSEPRAAANAAFVRAGNYLLVLEADGELLVADANNKTAFTPIKRYRVADADTWPAPSLSGNRIFVKDVSSLTLWTVD